MADSLVSRLYTYISGHFAPLFWSVFIVAFIAAFIQLNDKKYLTNTASPHGIVSLELGWNGYKDNTIIQAWKTDTTDAFAISNCGSYPVRVDRLAKARFDTYVDYIFILAYTSLAIIIIAGLQSSIGKAGTRFSNFLLKLSIIAGFSDCIENIGLLYFIHEEGSSGLVALVTSIASSVKFLILIFLLFIYLPYTLIFPAGGLKRLSEYIRNKAIQLFKYRIILLGVLIFSAPIWILDQGQDLLINSNSSDIAVGLFLLVVIIAALLNWYLAKLFFERQYKGPVYPFKEPSCDPTYQLGEKKVSRFLGIMTILIPSASILHAMQVIKVPYPLDIFPPGIVLIALLALFFTLVKTDAATAFYKRRKDRWGKPKSLVITLSAILSLSIVIPLLIRMFMIGHNAYTPQSLYLLFLHMILLTFAFYLFVSLRTYVFANWRWTGDWIGVPVIIAGGILAGFFILINFFPLLVVKIDQPILSLPVLLSGVVFYTLAFTLLVRISLWKNINFILFGFIIGLVISISAVNDYHSVRMEPVPTNPREVTLTEYYRQWIMSRRKEIEDPRTTTYPIFIINTYGGGIRAAAFTNMVITYLDSIMLADGNPSFEHYAFSISGASGGTIGAAVQCAFRAANPDHNVDGTNNSKKYTLNVFNDFYRHDFLTPVLSNMLGRDIWASASSLQLWKDRSAIQEQIWEKFGSRTPGLDLNREFNALWDTIEANTARYEIPLLFSNTLNVDDGLKGIMAPVSLEHGDFPASIFIRDRIKALNAGQLQARSVTLMTGAFLSARFPFISPSGKMGPGYHFMDGGGKDNSGASTSEAIFLALARYNADTKKKGTDTVFNRLMDKIRFCFVSITNSPYSEPDSSRRLVANRFEPLSPLIGIINSGINGNARAADSTLRFRYLPDSARYAGFSADYCQIWPTAYCVSDGNGEYYTPILPLGWQISAPSLQRLRQSFTSSMINDYNGGGIRKVLKILNNR